MNEKWFFLSIAEIEKKLKTNAASGLSRKAARSAWYRTFPKANTLFVRKSKSSYKMLTEVLSDFSLILLLIAALFALLFAEHEIGITVLSICLINIAIAFIIYLKTQRAMEKIDLYFTPTAKVIRGGKLYRIEFENVVPGDVILVQKGDIICADARIVTSDDLSVIMRVNKQKVLKLKKQAQCIISEDEVDPTKMSNILHAGSVVKDGCGRAIVFATGTYTYLGAMTGGIVQSYNDNIPAELKKMKKVCSQISFISMLCILPFTVVSLLLSHLNNGTATLSASFLTALALCASSMTQLSCTICKLFFVKKISAIAHSQNPAIIRTTDAFDKLSGIDYLFLLDGSSLTDGILHFDTAFTIEGDINKFDTYNSTVSALFNFAAIYNSAENNAITTGINLPGRYKTGLEEFLGKGHADIDELKIRYPIKAYIQGTPSDPEDKVHFLDFEKKMILNISTSNEIFSRCSHTLMSGKTQQLSNVGIDRLKNWHSIHASQGKTILSFTLSSFDSSDTQMEKIFIGAIVLREGADKNAFTAINNLKKFGVKVISFVGGNRPSDVPEIPVDVHYGETAQRSDFVNKQLPITHNFGNIDTYYGLLDKDIEDMIDHAHGNKFSVGVVGFSDFAKNVISKSDVFISCSSIINTFSAKSEEELYTLELEGAGTSKSCIQTIKDSSDVLIQRPNNTSGGLRSICSVFFATEVAYRNLYAFFRYLICAQFIRLILIALPMMYGKPILDSRHVLICSFILDMSVLLTMAIDKKAIGTNFENREYRITTLKKHIKSNYDLMIAALVSSILAIFLPIIFNNIGIFGMYLYQVEYLLSSIIWLHLAAAFYSRYGSIRNISSFIKNKGFLGIVLGSISFVWISSTLAPLGLLFDVVFNPINYLMLSFVPCIMFGVVYELLPKKRIIIKQK